LRRHLSTSDQLDMIINDIISGLEGLSASDPSKFSLVTAKLLKSAAFYELQAVRGKVLYISFSPSTKKRLMSLSILHCSIPFKNCISSKDIFPASRSSRQSPDNYLQSFTKPLLDATATGIHQNTSRRRLWPCPHYRRVMDDGPRQCIFPR
jgi:hypothetical protein